MMKKPIIYIIALLTFSSFAFTILEDELPKILRNKFEKYIEAKSPDRIFVHTDRDLFYKGETIWLKAYLTNANTRKLHEKNDILFVQLFNKFGDAVLEKKFKASSGIVKAQLDLPDSLQGTYLMVAYNQWQLNFGQDHLFRKKIKIEAFQETKDENPLETLDYDFQIFPEGGNLVENIESKVGFKATSSFGTGADVYGYLIRNGSDTLLTFASEHGGIGSFTFTPETGNSYKLVLDAMDISKEFSIPFAEQEGVVLTVDNKDDGFIKCKITRSPEFSAEPLVVGIFQNGKLSDDAVKDLSGKKEILFAKKNLNAGVAVITVFNKNLVPLVERVVFITQEKQAEVNIQVNTKDKRPRGKVAVTVNLRDPEGKPLPGEFSVALYPARFSRNEPPANIVQYLLLSSEIKGEIENPEFYLSDNKNAGKALDDLLLVQGWRKFNWREIKSENYRVKHEREDKVTLKGKVFLIKDNHPFGNNSVTASVGGIDPYFQYIVLDDNGMFSIDASEIPDGQLYFQSTAPYKYGIKVDLEKNTLTSLQNIDLNTSLDFNRENELRKVFAIYNSFDLLKRKEAIVVADKKQLQAPHDIIVDLDEYVAFDNMAEVIKEIVPGAKIRKKKEVYNIKLLDMDKKVYYKYNPLFIVDGIPVYDLQIIMNMDQSEVKLIEMIRSKEGIRKYGHLGMGGVFQIRTRTGSFMPPNIEGIAGFDYKGIEKSKEFFSPKYKSSSKTKNFPDFRNTLLWNPDLSIGEDGTATFDFHFSDELEDIVIEVQGLTKEGIPVYSKQLIRGMSL